MDQERHWNSDAAVFKNWFALYNRTYEKFGITVGDRYNMDEKDFYLLRHQLWGNIPADIKGVTILIHMDGFGIRIIRSVRGILIQFNDTKDL